MSKTVWNILGGLTILAALYLLSQIPDRLSVLPPEDHTKFLTGMGLFIGVLGVIAGTCFLPKSRPVTLRILGAIGVVGCVFNLVEGFRQRDFAQFPIILVFWLPGSIYLMIKGKMSDEPSA